VPPVGLIVGKLRRGRPHIYTETEVARIVARAAKLPSRYGMRGWSCSTMFGLIAVTGLRINEAIALDDDDVDLDEGVITIRRGKNGTARYVPLAPSIVARLRAYRAERTRLLGRTPGPFFRMESGERPTDCCARYNFALVSQASASERRNAFVLQVRCRQRAAAAASLPACARYAGKAAREAGDRLSRS
jgi:integrase/recombinase XerD